MTSRALIAAALVFAFAGCAGDDPHGSIVELSYVPAHRANVEVDDYTLLCTPSGQSVVCVPMLVGSHLEARAFDAQWNADLEHCSPDSKCSKQSIEITQRQYQTWSVGDWYPTVEKSHGLRGGR